MWDSRAYRFNSSSVSNGPYTKLYNIGSYDNDNMIYVTPTNSFFPMGINYAINQVPIACDCINVYNNVSQDYSGISTMTTPASQFKYQSNGQTIGGSGTNISYSFISAGFVGIDDNTNVAYVSSTNSYANVNQFSHNMVGYQRDEIYSFAIELINTEGQWSNALWIADIRFPNYNDLGLEYNLVDSVNYTIGSVLGIQFTINNLPTGCVGFRILRCERKIADRTVLAQGVTCPVLNISNVCTPPILPTTVYQANTGTYFYLGIGGSNYTGTNNTILQQDLVEFISPEVSYTTGGIPYENGDYIQPIGMLSRSNLFNRLVPGTAWTSGLPTEKIGSANALSPYSHTQIEFVLKYGQFSSLSGINPSTPLGILHSTLVTPPAYMGDNASCEITIGGYAYCNWSNELVSTGGETPFMYGRHGTVQLINLNSGLSLPANQWMFDPGNLNLFVCLYRRSIMGYNGPGYSSRSTREYIPCSDIIYTTSNTILRVTNGDVYISNFEYQRLMTFGLSAEEAAGHSINGFLAQTMHIPLETTINLNYKTNLTYNNFTNTDFAYLIQEQPGIYYNEAGGNPTLIQTSALYSYNSAYSRVNNITKHYPLAFNAVINPLYDNRFQMSARKFNNEIIDSWTLWDQTQNRDVDGRNGPLNVVVNHTQDLVFMQSTAIGIMAVEERVMLPGAGITGGLNMGTGVPMSRYDYISTTDGCQDFNSVEIGRYGMIYYDRSNNSLYSIEKGAGAINITKASGLQSWVNDVFIPNNITNIITGYAPEYNELFLTIVCKNQPQTYTTICYNEVTKTFTDFRTWNTRWCYINTPNYMYSASIGNNIFSPNTTLMGKLWLHDNSPLATYSLGQEITYPFSKGNFEGTVYPARFSIIVNPNADLINVFDVIHWLTQYGNAAEDPSKFYIDTSDTAGNSKFTETYDVSTANGLMPHTYTSITIQNRYQTTGKIALTPNINVTRRFDTWRFNQIRNLVDNARLTSSWIVITFEFDNSTNLPIICYDISTEYRPTVPH